MDRPVKPKSNIVKRPVTGPIKGPAVNPTTHAPSSKGPHANVAAGFNPAAVQRQIQDSMSACYYSTMPSCLRMLYSIPVNYQSNAANSFAMVEYSPNNYATADLDTFYSIFSPYQYGHYPVFESVDGGQLYQTSMEDEVEPSLGRHPEFMRLLLMLMKTHRFRYCQFGLAAKLDSFAGWR